jgi:NADPH-dependent 2,4-dienoyl-CoA reductase/sulfur reductase-like enzyme
MGTRLVVVGGDGAGMAAASVARRRSADLEVVALEKGRWTSYSACGIPYLIGGEVGGLDDLVVRTPDDFRAQRIDMRTGHEVLGIDLDDRSLQVRHEARDRTYRLGFDLLHVATGAKPVRPPIPGLDGDRVYGIQNLEDARSLLAETESLRPRHVVVVGSGYIGLELAEAFIQRDASVTVLERTQQVLGLLDADMAAHVATAMRSMGIDLRLGEALEGVDEDGVVTGAGSYPADLVILGIGVEANSDLAADAGLALGVRGGIVVDRQQRTAVEGVFAAGDCCQTTNIVSGRATYVPLGTTANKQGRVVGINASGGYATFPGVAGTAVTRICATEIGRTGLNETEAAEAGFGYVKVTIDATTKAGYMPDNGRLTVKMLGERGTGRVLGAQIVGGHGAAKRVDAVAVALAAGMDAEELMMSDLGYAPPYSSTWDPVQVAARALLSEL